MKKTLILLISTLLISSLGFGQKKDTVSFEDIRPYVYEFDITAGQLQGEGADLLRRHIEESQFMLLSEVHNIREISQFTAAVLPELASAGYGYFAAEVGPHSAQKLMALSQKPSQTTKRLYDFNTHYGKLARFIPVPFFSGVEDARFLQVARQQDFQLWGIDQEFATAPFFLIDEVLERHKGSPDYPQISEKHQQLMDFLKELARKEDEENYRGSFNDLLQSKEVDAFFAALGDEDSLAVAVHRDLRRSWEIYRDHSQNIYKNLEGRAALMKEYFSYEYKKALAKKGKLPKALIKMGSLHIRRGYTFNQVFDIGSFAHELAAFNGSKALNISFEWRYAELSWAKPDRLEDEKYKELWPLLKAGRKDKWIIIDLQPLKEKMVKREVKMTEALRKRIIWHDLIIIPPNFSKIKYNFATDS